MIIYLLKKYPKVGGVFYFIMLSIWGELCMKYKIAEDRFISSVIVSVYFALFIVFVSPE